MSYSIDLRERVIGYVQNGGSQAEASVIFKISRKTIYNWMQRTDLSAKPRTEWDGKLDKALLAAHVRDHPDALLRERAAHFGVRINAIWSALQRLGIRKKNDAIC